MLVNATTEFDPTKLYSVRLRSGTLIVGYVRRAGMTKFGPMIFVRRPDESDDQKSAYTLDAIVDIFEEGGARTYGPITVYSNWCYYDRLGDVDIVDGERLLLRWPDESETDEIVRVVKSKQEGSDHGKRCDLPVQTAVVDTIYRGVTLRVPLEKSGVLAARP